MSWDLFWSILKNVNSNVNFQFLSEIKLSWEVRQQLLPPPPLHGLSKHD